MKSTYPAVFRPSSDAPPQRFQTLDGWRGICALLVAVGHFNVDDHLRSVPFVMNSYLLVDFFFVLSGFVISHAYAHRVRSISDARFFVLRRFARLWPLHMTILLAYLCLYLVTLRLPGLTTGPHSASSFVSNIFMLHAFGLHDSLTWNYPSWSISAEFYTYLAFAALAGGCLIRLVPCAVISGVGFLALLFLEPKLMHTECDITTSFRCLYGFFAGAFVWRLSRSFSVAAAWATPLELAFVGATGLLMVYGGTLWEMAGPVLFAGTVWVFSKQGGLLSRLIGSTPISTLGTWSYSIYMVHAFIGLLVYNAFATVASKFGIDVFHDGRLSIGTYTDALTLTYVCVVIAVSAISYRMIELPGQRFIPQAGALISCAWRLLPLMVSRICARLPALIWTRPDQATWLPLRNWATNSSARWRRNRM